MEERNETIIRLVKEGETLRAAGERYGLTRQRVAQIVKGYVDTRKRRI
jgi:DNA-directed RNA polymerase specialized sigma subunit